MNATQDDQRIQVHIRWIVRHDYPEVLAIESKSFEFPWLEKDFIRCLRQRNAIGMVAEHDDRVVGYMIYELYKRRIRLPNFAVAGDCRRQRVGTQMIDKLTSKLSVQRRREITLVIRETNMPGQSFFSACGFRAVSVLREFYPETNEDGYVMRWQLQNANRPGDTA